VDNTADKFEYDKISKEHLDKARKGSPGTSAQDFARSLDLTDAKTLVGVLELANDEQKQIVVQQLELANDEQKQIVVQQLRSVTGEELTSLADWKEHLSIEK